MSTTLVLIATVVGGASAGRQEPGELARQALERWGIEGVEVDFDPDTRMVRLRRLVA